MLEEVLWAATHSAPKSSTDNNVIRAFMIA